MLASSSGQVTRDPLGHRAHNPHIHYSSVSLSGNSDTLSMYAGEEYSSSGKVYPPTSIREWPTSPGYPRSITNLDHLPIEDRGDDKDDDAFTISTRRSSNHEDQRFVVPDDDSVSFFSIPPTSTATHGGAAADGLLSPKSQEVQEDERHMSVLGPKMRFVSPAPWESDQDDALGEDEENYGPADALSMFSSGLTWRSRQQEKSHMRSCDSVSPTSSELNAPSRLTQEMQRDGSYGVSYNKGASRSHSAIPNRFASPRSSESASDSPDTLVYLLPDTHLGNVSSNSQDPLGQSYHSTKIQNVPRLQDDAGSLHSTSDASSRFMHPYANPDLLQARSSPSSMAATRQYHERKSDERDSQDEYVRRASEPATTISSPRSNLRKTSAGDVPLPAMPSRKIMASHEEEDMIPCAQGLPRIRTTSYVTPPRSMTPFGEETGNPMQNLISLEEARTLQKYKGRDSSSVSMRSVTSSPSSTLVAGFGLAPGVSPDRIIRNQGRSATAPFSDLPFSRSVPRQRTLGSGTPPSSEPLPADGKDVTPVKTVKHRKSGFMKLFQSTKEKEKERGRDQMKELSSVAEPRRRSTSTPPRLVEIKPDDPIPPVPSLHNSNLSPPPSFNYPKPIPPPISTLSTTPLHPSYEPNSSSSLDVTRPPASAPATRGTFEGLSLRPVSTMFSAKFPELLSSVDSSHHVQSATTSEIKTPTTPGFSTRSSFSTASDYPITPSFYTASGSGINASRDEMLVALQEQLSNTRKKYQRQIWELEGQVKELKAENEELRNTGDCETCGKAKRMCRVQSSGVTSVVDRPRPKVGGVNRTVFGGNNEMR